MFFLLKRILIAFTAKRLFNAVIVYLDYLLSAVFRKKILKTKPLSISIEISANCNLKCPECNVSLHNNGGRSGNIDMTSIRKIINATGDKIFYVNLFFQGEPLLNKNIFEIIKKFKEKKVIVGTSTNAHFLDENTAKALVKSGLDRIVISLDGADSDTYSAYRVGGDFELVIRNLRNLMKIKRELNSDTPIVELQFIVFKHNEHQIESIKKLAKDLGTDKVTIKSAQIDDFVNGNALMTSLKKYSRYREDRNGKYYNVNTKKKNCFRLISGSVFTVDGEILPCCYDKNADYSFGNINDDNFNEIFNGGKRNGLIKAVLKDKSKIHICSNCNM